MAPPYSPRVSIHGVDYFPPPYSTARLGDLRWGLIGLGAIGILSVVSTLCLIGFILSRMVSWRSQHHNTSVGYNQYVVLVLNLLMADFQQAASFLISFHWLRMDAILSPSAPCFAQGWLIHSGDVGSGLFVLAIALHTFYTAVYGQRVSNTLFRICIVGLWIFAYFLTAIGVGIHREKLFTASGAWCWISPDFEHARLWFHYFWIFLIEFSTIGIYIVTFWRLRRKTRRLFDEANLTANSGHSATVKAVNRVTLLMMLYPFVYVVLTLPLSSGRMWSMAHHGTSTSRAYSITAGCLLASCGWVDTLLYTLTRRRLLRDSESPNTSARRTSSAIPGEVVLLQHSPNKTSIVQTRTVTVETDGLSEFDMYYPSAAGMGGRLVNSYSVETSANGTPSGGGNKQVSPTPTGVFRLSRGSKSEKSVRFDANRDEKNGQEEFPGSLAGGNEVYQGGWGRLGSNA